MTALAPDNAGVKENEKAYALAGYVTTVRGPSRDQAVIMSIIA